MDRVAGFHRLEDFASWLVTTHGQELGSADVVVGHSMGGLLGLMLCAQGAIPKAKIVLVDAHLAPIAPFFRTTFAPTTDEAIRSRATMMLHEEIPHYNMALREQLKAGDFLELAGKAAAGFGAIYGLPDSQDTEGAAEKMNWPDWLKSKVILRFVPGCAHFPMLEDPKGFLAILEEILFSLEKSRF